MTPTPGPMPGFFMPGTLGITGRMGGRVTPMIDSFSAPVGCC